MPLTALGLLFLAAVLHAIWNLLVKNARQKQVFTWWALVAGTVCFAPLLLFTRAFPIQVWPLVICSGLVEAAYYITLTRAYEHGDFSLVYPMARGTAPAFLVLWAIFFLGERPRPAGFVGLALLVLGLVIVGGKNWWALRKTTKLSTSGLVLALGVACCISIYSAIDGAAVRIVSPLPYTVLVISLATIFFTPLVLLRYGHNAVVSEWRTNWLRIILVGILSFLSYMLVLVSYTLAPVSYAGAVREVSIVFATFIGWRWLREDLGLLRM
ncbi:MAG: EamA family transporter, partial [Chloroflexota bacterium]|nr:EamA family transporter [Chloroflexota bacterium]